MRAFQLSALLVGVSLLAAGCSRDVSAYSPDQLQREYGISGAYTGQISTPDGSLRGTLVPVYDLRLVMGHPATETARWLGLVGSEAPIGLVFDGFEGHLRVPREAITRAATGSTTSLANEVLHASDPVRLLVHLPSVLAAIRASAHQGVSPKEK